MLLSPAGSAQDRDQIAAIVAALPKRTEPERALVRIAALLRQYFQTDTAQSVIEVEAEDWLAEMRDFPDWAIRRACRWWQGADNPNRRRKPMIGDIVEICRNEVALLSMARVALTRNDRPAIAVQQGDRKRVTAEQAAAIIRKAYGDDVNAESIGQPKTFPTTGAPQ